MAWRVLHRVRPGFRQLSAGVHPPRQQLAAGFPHGLAAEVHLQNAPHLLFKGHVIGCAAEGHHRHIGTHFADFVQQMQLVCGHGKAFPVVALPLVLVGQAAEKQHRFLPRGQSQRLFLQFPVFLVFQRISGRVSDRHPQLPQGVQRIGEAGRVDMAAAAALKTHLLRQSADDHHVRILRNREYPVVFQQDGAFAGKLLCNLVGVRRILFRSVVRRVLFHQFFDSSGGLGDIFL